MERFFSWRRINNHDDPDQPIAAKRDSWRTFVRLENENKMKRLLRRGNACVGGRTPQHDRALSSSGCHSVAPGDAASCSRSCEPRREHQPPVSVEISTCLSPADSQATEHCGSVEGSTASFHANESFGHCDQQSTRTPINTLPEYQSAGVGLNAKTIERLWKWKSAYRVQLEELEVRNAMLADHRESLKVQVKEQESRIDSLSFRLSQYEGLESRVEERFVQLQGELDRLQQTEKSRETHQDCLLHSVEEAGKTLEVLQTQYQSRLPALEAVKPQSFDVLQRLYAEKNLHGDELVALRGHVEKLLDQVDRLRRIS